MFSWAAFFTLISFVGSAISIYQFIRLRQGSKPEPRRLAIICAAVFIVVLIFSIVFANILSPSEKPGLGITPVTTSNPQQETGITPTPTPVPPTPTPTPSPTPTLPCIINISTWTGGSADWKVSNGVLLSDGTNPNAEEGSPTIVAPCQLSNTANYAVEAQIQVLSHGYNACFGIDARGTTTSNGWQGYIGGMFFGCGVYSPTLAITPDYTAYYPWIDKILYDPGTGMHTYRFEVNGNRITFSIDGTQQLATTDNRYLTGGQVGLWSFEVQLSVTSFKVVTV